MKCTGGCLAYKNQTNKSVEGNRRPNCEKHSGIENGVYTVNSFELCNVESKRDMDFLYLAFTGEDQFLHSTNLHFNTKQTFESLDIGAYRRRLP